MITLHKNKQTKKYLIHRLVAETFIPKIDGKNYVNHIDSNTKNNKVDNLEWCTQSENILHGYKLGNKIPPHQKKVIQLTLDNKNVEKYKSTAEASKITGIQQANISACARGKRKQAGGYIWKYIE